MSNIHTILYAPSFWRSISLFLGALVHLVCFLFVLFNINILFTGIAPSLTFWTIFFLSYSFVAGGVMLLGIKQLLNFLKHAEEEYAKIKDLEGYETIQGDINRHYEDGESGEAYDVIDYYYETLAEKRT